MNNQEYMKYEMKEMEINNKNIDKYEYMEDRRWIRTSHKEHLIRLLLAGKHFETPIVINSFNGNFRIIDGNHRFEAIKHFTKDGKSIRVKAVVYKNLNDYEERQVYDLWSQGIKQTLDDKLQLLKKEIPLYNILKNYGFPVSIYKTRSDSIPLKYVVNILKSSKKTGKIYNPVLCNQKNVIDVAKSYGETEAEEVISFFRKTFIPVFGRVRDNPYFKPVFLIPLFNAWYYNVGMLGCEDINKRFHRLIGDPEINMWMKMNTVDIRILMRERILNICDRRSRKKMLRNIQKE